MQKIQRQSDVIRLKAIGFKLVDIARYLGISRSTVNRDLKPEYAEAHRAEAREYKKNGAKPPEKKICRACQREFTLSGKQRRDSFLCGEDACRWTWAIMKPFWC